MNFCELLKKKSHEPKVEKHFFSSQENDTELFITAIFEQWNASNGAPAPTSSNGVGVKKIEEVDIAKLLETQARIVNQSVKQKPQISEEERRIKQQILANYSQSTVKEEEEEEEGAIGEEDEDDPDLEKNTNKADVQKLAREKREQARSESAAKKLKDKEDRAKQKANREDKKSARKERAVKGERKR